VKFGVVVEKAEEVLAKLFPEYFQNKHGIVIEGKDLEKMNSFYDHEIRSNRSDIFQRKPTRLLELHFFEASLGIGFSMMRHRSLHNLVMWASLLTITDI
jgi:hypothetical protein